MGTRAHKPDSKTYNKEGKERSGEEFTIFGKPKVDRYLAGLLRLGRTRWRRNRSSVHRSDKSVSAPRKRINVARRLRCVAVHLPKPRNGSVKATVEDDEGIVRPDLRSSFVAR